MPFVFSVVTMGISVAIIVTFPLLWVTVPVMLVADSSGIIIIRGIPSAIIIRHIIISSSIVLGFLKFLYSLACFFRKFIAKLYKSFRLSSIDAKNSECFFH